MSKAEEFDAVEKVEQQDEEKLVPVGEAIKYRKRAQAAEQERAELDGKLEEFAAVKEKLEAQLSEIRKERELIGKLSAAGVIDMEAAVLMAKAKLSEDEERDVETVIESLREEKSYLFSRAFAAELTAGVREKTASGRRNLEKLAKRAATSGKRSDVQEYLRERRKFV